MTASRPNLEVLLRHQDWVRALARSLVADPSRADDVAQQTMLEAIRRPPRDLSRPQGWLAKVAGNIARGLARQESRRTRREQAVARSRVLRADPADPADAAQRAAMHKQLVDALFELPEPYHTVVLLRYFEDLDARQIAAQLDHPLATVRTQLQRGLERMREKLDHRFGDREAWSAALLPLFAPKQAVAAIPVLGTAGALVMLKWMIPLVAASAAVFFSLHAAGMFADPVAPPVGASPPAEVVVAQREPAPVPDANREVVAGVPAASAGSAALAAPGNGVVAGRLVDLTGRPVVGSVVSYYGPDWPRLVGSRLSYRSATIDVEQPGLREQLADDRGLRRFAATFAPHAAVVEALLRGQPVPAPRAVTDGLGRFELAGIEDEGGLRCEDADWIIYGEGRASGDDERVFVAGPGVAVAGRIVRADGQALADVHVSVGFTLSNLPGIAQTLQGSDGYRSFNASTDTEGRFALGVVPRHAEIEIEAKKRGYRSLATPTTEVVGPVQWLLHEQRDDGRKLLTGFVQKIDGSPAAGAAIVFGQDSGKAGDDGRFEVPLTYFGDETILVAYLPQQQPAIVEGLGARLQLDQAAGRDLVLRLGEPTLSISGQVVDRDGRPRAGVRVLLDDGVPYGSAMMSVESVIGDRRGDGERTDADGRFVLTGLSARTYNVRAIDDASLLVLESGPVPAGSEDLRLREPADAFIERLEGVLVDAAGVPVAGATVAVTTTLARGVNGRRFLTLAQPVTSAAHGRFLIERCPRRHVELSIGGEGVVDHEMAVPADGTAMRVVVKRKLRFRVRSCAIAADRFTVHDASGQQLPSVANELQVTRTAFQHEIDAAASPVYEVDDRAVTLVLMAGSRELRRLPLNLQHDVLNELDL